MVHGEVSLCRTILALVASIFISYGGLAAIRPAPEYLKSAVVYQIVLRNFTRDGNFAQATRMLDHVRSLGVDAVYLSPFVEMDRDMDVSGWSQRQVKSGFNSPKNPYRISDYDKIDPEYGGDPDFKAFNDRAHALGMRVYMDLVYLHCGPNNVLKDMFPDAFQRNADGAVRMTAWHFPYVNLGSKNVRKYLIDSMLHWVRLGCDGFRCDVGDEVPIEFWEEAVKACRAVKPDLVMINEGTKVEWLEKVFDACYALPWSYTVRGCLVDRPELGPKGKDLPEKMNAVRDYESKVPSSSLMFAFLDNHDTATDDWERRFDRVRPVEAGNAAFVLTFLRRGLPLVFCGNEVADNALKSFLAPVESTRRAAKTVDWGRALEPDGRKRLALIRRLAELRHTDKVFSGGGQEWVTDGESQNCIAFVRRLDSERAVFVAANLSSSPVRFRPSGIEFRKGTSPILASAAQIAADGALALGAWGYIVVDL